MKRGITRPARLRDERNLYIAAATRADACQARARAEAAELRAIAGEIQGDLPPGVHDRLVGIADRLDAWGKIAAERAT